MAEIKLAIIRISNDSPLSIGNLRAFTIDNRGNVDIKVGPKNNANLPIPAGYSRTFELNPPDKYSGDETWEITFDADGNKEVYIIRSNVINEDPMPVNKVREKYERQGSKRSQLPIERIQ